MRKGGCGLGVVVGQRVRAPINKQGLFGTGLEPLVGGDDRWSGGKVFRKVEGDWGEGDNSDRRGVAMKAKVVIALYWYLGFLFLSRGQSQDQLKNR